MGVALKRFLSIQASLVLLVFLASDGLAQRGVGVRARPNEGVEKRMALVIGNAQYKKIPALRNFLVDASPHWPGSS